MLQARAWTAETPNMYTLLVTLSRTAADGSAGGHSDETVEVLRVRVGLRHVQVSQGRLRVNGTPVTIRGVNRHEHTPDSGHVVSLASMAHDIQVIRENNCFSRQLNLENY